MARPGQPRGECGGAAATPPAVQRDDASGRSKRLCTPRTIREWRPSRSRKWKWKYARACRDSSCQARFGRRSVRVSSSRRRSRSVTVRSRTLTLRVVPSTGRRRGEHDAGQLRMSGSSKPHELGQTAATQRCESAFSLIDLLENAEYGARQHFDDKPGRAGRHLGRADFGNIHHAGIFRCSWWQWCARTPAVEACSGSVAANTYGIFMERT